MKLLHKIAQLIVLMFEHDAPVIEQAAVAAAVGVAETDPKVQAVQESATAFVAAAHALKNAMETPAPAAETPSTPAA